MSVRYGGVVLARYRYRIEPDLVQRGMLARTFGCVRVVFNDVIRCQDEAFRSGVSLGPTEVQRRVITEAKTSPERVWLAEIASVALVQSVRDANRAYRNFFDSVNAKRKGRRMGRPRFKSRKDRRQSFRLTRNGFRLRSSGRLYLAKVGEVRVRWSRPLPSEPSSVTIIREPDGHYYASFVVEVEPTPLPVVDREAGVDLGIARLATVVDSAGKRTDLPNPRHLARKQHKLTRLHRDVSRCARGSANRLRAQQKLALQHSKVARSRLDCHHKLALTLVRENQAVYLEDLNIAGMVRNRRLARAISDAGWAQLARLINQKAARYGRGVVQVSRWFPSSKMCSSCGHLTDALPLQIRAWCCLGCGAVHDRDANAAGNILAAGRAERQNAGGAPVNPPFQEGAGL